MKKIVKSVMSACIASAMLLTAFAVPTYAEKATSAVSTVKVVKSQLDFASKSKSAKGTGWEWDNETKTLTLENFYQKTTEEAIILPDDKVIVKLIGKNNITVNSAGTRDDMFAAYCIFSNGDILFTGSGSLTCNCTNSVGGSAGIAGDAVLIDIDGKLTINSNCDNGPSRGIFTQTTTNIDSGNVKINCTNKYEDPEDMSIGITADSSFEISKNASLEINYDGLGNFCGVCSLPAEGLYGKYSNYGTYKADINSSNGYAYGIIASSVTEAGKNNMKVHAKATAVGISADVTIGITDADFNADITSDAESGDDLVIGIECYKFVNIYDSNVKINCISTKGVDTEGICSRNEIYAKNSNLDIYVKSTKGLACGAHLGVFENNTISPVGVTFDGCTGTIKVGGDGYTVIAAKSLTLKDCTAEKCGEILSFKYDDTDYYSFSDSGKSIEVDGTEVNNLAKEVVLTKQS